MRIFIHLKPQKKKKKKILQEMFVRCGFYAFTSVS